LSVVVLSMLESRLMTSHDVDLTHRNGIEMYTMRTDHKQLQIDAMPH